MMDWFREIWEKGERLMALREYLGDGEMDWAIIRIELQFESLCAVIRVTDDDELSCEVFQGKENGASEIHRFVWEPALGTRVSSFWIMKNQSGYLDGIQIAFADDIKDTECVIQLQAMASTIYAFSVNEVA